MYKLQVKSANGHAWPAGVPVSPRTQDDGAPDVVHEGPEREEDIGEGTAANTRNDLAPGLPKLGRALFRRKEAHASRL